MFRCHNQSFFATVLSVIGFLLAFQSAVAQDSPTTSDPVASEFSLTREITIPLQNGKIDFGDLLGSLLDELGLDGSMARQKINWQFHPDSHMGRGPLLAVESATNNVVTFKIAPDRLVIVYDRLQFQRETKRIRKQVGNYVTRFFPAAAAAVQAQFGFRIHAEVQHQNSAPVEFDFETARRNGRQFVILVHGLDDPGRIWGTLRPILLEHNYIVCEFDYPNDQAIADSAGLLATELQKLRKLGLTEASIVAHSMGGLVVREVLTNPAYYHGDSSGGGGEGAGTYPALEKFMMVGVPNHGSQMARLRFTSEIRDQIVRTLSGEGLIFGGFFDGAGEAQIDLLPNSEFLLNLNARPLPAPIQLTSVAGIASPIDHAEVQQILERFTALLPMTDDPEASAESFADGLENLTNGFGDGCVSLRSTKIEGVTDEVVVPGNHVTMIRNLPYHNTARMPPAIPIILARLK